MPKAQRSTIAIPHTLGDESQQNGAADLLGDDDEANAARAADAGLGDADDLTGDLDGDDLDGDDDNYSPATDIAELRGQLNNITTLLAGGGNKKEVAADAGMPGLDLNNLPDPVTKKDDFNRELAARITTWASKQTESLQSQSQQMTASQRAAELESRFMSQYPDLGKRKALMTVAVQQEAAALRQKGRDVQTVMNSDPDKFLARVARRMQNELGITDDSSAEGRQSRRTPGRTAGVGAGSRGVSAGKKNTQDQPIGFVAAIKKQQMEMGLY